MKKFISVLMIAAGMSCFMASAQKPEEGKSGNGEWFQRMKSEKIAFITAELSLTPEEAQVFWPVYNAAEKESFECVKASRQAYKAMKEAIKENKSDAEISRLLDEYVAADAEIKVVAQKYLPEYKKVLPAAKVAKLYVSEEKFRKSQMCKLQNGGPGSGKQGGQEMHKGMGGHPGGPGSVPGERPRNGKRPMPDFGRPMDGTK